MHYVCWKDKTDLTEQVLAAGQAGGHDLAVLDDDVEGSDPDEFVGTYDADQDVLVIRASGSMVRVMVRCPTDSVQNIFEIRARDA
jgi:hypothetical protein